MWLMLACYPFGGSMGFSVAYNPDFQEFLPPKELGWWGLGDKFPAVGDVPELSHATFDWDYSCTRSLHA